ncbi:uncharacterized protein N7479_003786 [Penicillium vulpinum]|uniref:Uncharacterized protein n=1 Tax=Penicillium vulpinum TaxID=29845 RepID=A0A1V6QYZ6_9EURO|nr:uncharacterized protein N7479_003786 [Penicillium vulpinum]KAJ5963910.1 hypothetical protein N7479_003786 [Penicillium vulpinum]OQD94297.1 hypothetical protein PENVUL_c150G07621 [Penicillium vulpinum]
MPPMDLASARGTKISDIVIDNRPSTGRGKKLTLAQESLLRRLYEQELPSVSNDEPQAKGFWVKLASQFHQQTGREYSWSSVKRRAAGWHQKSPEIERRLDASRASELGIEDSVVEPSHQDTVRESPRRQGLRDSEHPVLPQSKPSPHLQDSNTLELSQLERSPGVGDWSQRNSLSSVKDSSQDTSRNLKSPRVSPSRPRSRSPQRASQPRYRRRSPSTTRRAKIIPKQLRHQLASSSDGTIATSHNPLSGSFSAHDNVQLSHPSKGTPPELNRAREPVEKDGPESHARGFTRSKRGENKVSNDLLASPNLSEQDDLPLTPTRITRRRVSK